MCRQKFETYLNTRIHFLQDKTKCWECNEVPSVHQFCEITGVGDFYRTPSASWPSSKSCPKWLSTPALKPDDWGFSHSLFSLCKSVVKRLPHWGCGWWETQCVIMSCLRLSGWGILRCEAHTQVVRELPRQAWLLAMFFCNSLNKRALSVNVSRREMKGSWKCQLCAQY